MQCALYWTCMDVLQSVSRLWKSIPKSFHSWWNSHSMRARCLCGWVASSLIWRSTSRRAFSTSRPFSSVREKRFCRGGRGINFQVPITSPSSHTTPTAHHRPWSLPVRSFSPYDAQGSIRWCSASLCFPSRSWCESAICLAALFTALLWVSSTCACTTVWFTFLTCSVSVGGWVVVCGILCSVNFKYQRLESKVPFSLVLWIHDCKGLILLASVGLTVVSSFAVMLLPFGSVDSVLQIARRLFPFHRGLYEDKVANFWCSLRVAVKLPLLFSVSSLVILRCVSQDAAWLSPAPSPPSSCRLFHVFWWRLGQATKCWRSLSAPAPLPSFFSRFKCMKNRFWFRFSLHSFFIISTRCWSSGLWIRQCLGGRERGWNLYSRIVISMFPLLERDGLAIVYLSLMILWNAVNGFKCVEECRHTRLRHGIFVSLCNFSFTHVFALLL